MKHIKKIDELFKSTLMSAHDKLKTLHPTRASNLKDWADEKGESEFSKFHVDRIYPYKFVFSNISNLSDVKDQFLGSFYITDVEKDETIETQRYFGVLVYMMNDFGQKIYIYLSFTNGIATNTGIVNFKIKFGKDYKYERGFRFEDRRDALQFKKFLVEDGLPEVGISQSIVSNISINQLFTTK
jgi:hypothetical protein